MTALRSRARVILDAASKCDRAAMSSSSGGEGGLRGLVHRVRKTVLGGKFIRDDVGNDVLRRPVSETGFRMPSPGAQQQTPVVPQGPYQNVFDITYHSRDSRRLTKREEVTADQAQALARSAQLPPTPGTPSKTAFLGMIGDYDRQQ